MLLCYHSFNSTWMMMILYYESQESTQYAAERNNYQAIDSNSIIVNIY